MKSNKQKRKDSKVSFDDDFLFNHATQPKSSKSWIFVFVALAVSLYFGYTRVADLEERTIRLQKELHEMNERYVAVPEEQGQDKHVHAPHSHYDIDMRPDGRPVDLNREYSMEDFHSVFHVTPSHFIEFTPEAAEILDKTDITKDPYFFDFIEDIKIYSDTGVKYLDDIYAATNLTDYLKMRVKYHSKRSGFGVVAKKDFTKGEVVGIYSGVVDVALDDRFPNTDYLWKYPEESEHIPKNLFFGLDARVVGNYMRFVNHDENQNCGTVYIPYKNRWQVLYIALRNIKDGEWITANYGSGIYFDLTM